jgi:hypothetical protein
VSRPCECGNARVGELTPDQCRDCWKWVNSPWWRSRWETGTPPPPTPATPPCVHLGDRLTGAVREAAGLSHARDWRTCAKGHGEPAGVVCQCFPTPRGCRGCPDYRADE